MALTRSDVDYVEDPHTAARLYLELRHQRDRPGASQTETTAAMNKLERTWPEARELAANSSDDELGGLSAGLKRTRDAHRQELGVTAQQAASLRRAARSSASSRPVAPASSTGRKPSAASKPSRPPARRRGGGGRGPRLPGGVRVAGVHSAKSFGLQVLGLGLGLTLAYLLLNDTEHPGKSGIPIVGAAITSLSTAINALIGLNDPLRPKGSTDGAVKLVPTGKSAVLNVTATKNKSPAAVKASDLVIPSFGPVTRPRPAARPPTPVHP